MREIVEGFLFFFFLGFSVEGSDSSALGFTWAVCLHYLSCPFPFFVFLFLLVLFVLLFCHDDDDRVGMGTTLEWEFGIWLVSFLIFPPFSSPSLLTFFPFVDQLGSLHCIATWGTLQTGRSHFVVLLGSLGRELGLGLDFLLLVTRLLVACRHHRDHGLNRQRHVDSLLVQLLPR